MKARPGHSLVEAMLALVSGSVVCAGVAALLGSEQRLAAARVPRLGRTETVRITATVLRRELAAIDAVADLRGAGRDSVALRLFRGFAVVCSVTSELRLLVRFQGEREPDPARDSVLPLLPAGARALPLLQSSVANAPCPGAGELRSWDLGAEVAAGMPLLLFQKGAYYVSSRAFRVRHGDEGRQPLTGEWLNDRASSMVLERDARGDPARVAVRLGFDGGRTIDAFRIPFHNRFAPDTGVARSP